MKFDFSGYATKNDLQCSDGRIILKDAFKHNHGQKVPLVWQHLHNEPSNILGHAQLENRNDGVYAYCVFNNSPAAQHAKELVAHGDINALSIYANNLKQESGKVLHGNIRELSLVLAGANPGAIIDNLNIIHDDGNRAISETEAIIYTDDHIKKEGETVKHADGEESGKSEDDDKNPKKDDKTVADVFNSLSEEQKQVVYYMLGAALEDNANEAEKKGGDDDMKHNVFEGDNSTEGTLIHSQIQQVMDNLKNDFKRYGSLKECFAAREVDPNKILTHGVTNMEYLFPDHKNVTSGPPLTINRDMGWVSTVMSNVHNTPFSRIKSIFADLTEDEARARGYIKGKLKKEEVFSLLKRVTSPQTVYKKQRFDRDDIIDITEFDFIPWIKTEMRMMLNEELARAYLIGDGRLPSDDDKIRDDSIRPIWTDNDLYTIKVALDLPAGASYGEKAKAFIRAAVRARKEYKGSGNPTMFTTEDVLNDCLLMEDRNERVIYETMDKLATALRVKEIITVPVMENQTRTQDGLTYAIQAIIVNLQDYNVGADKGGAVALFDDFDIDYNAQKYLIETRCSAALIRPYSAIAIESIVRDSEELDAVG